MQAHPDERPGRGVEQAVGPGHPDQAIAKVAAGGPDRHQLRIGWRLAACLGIVVGDRCSDTPDIDPGFAAERVHPLHQLLEATRHHEVDTAPLKSFDRPWARARDHPLQQEPNVLVGQVRILLGAGERKLAADDRLVEHEPRVVETGLA
jgi:hypothetical protein